MYVSNMKRNARKSTHSGKVRQTSSTFQEFHSTSSHSALNHNSNPASSPLHSQDRSIWDTEFTAPEPTWHDSSSDVICISEEPAVKLKPIPGNVVKGCVASLKNKLKPDRNIFSALTKPAIQNQHSFNSRPTTTSTKHTPAILHHPSKTSRNLVKLYGSEFVFKKPTAPPPVSRLHLSSSSSKTSSRTSQQSHSRSTSTAQSGHVQNRQRNRHRDYSSETRRFTTLPPKARSGAKRSPQYASEINHRFCRDNLFSSRPFLEENSWSSAFGGKLSSSKSKLSNVPSRIQRNDRSIFQTSQQWSQFSSSQPQRNVRTKSTGKSPRKSASQATKKKFAMKRALMRQNISPSANNETFIDLCREKSVKKTHTASVRAPRRPININRVYDPHYVTQMSIEALSRRRNSSIPKSVPPLKIQPSTTFFHKTVQKSPNSQSNSQQESFSYIGAGSKDSTKVNYRNSCSAVKVIPTEQLEFRLSPLKFETEDSGDFDEVDGLLFVSFRTQSGLESYLRTPPEKPVNGPSGAASSNLPSPSASKRTSPQQENYKTRIEQFERQLKMDIQRNSNREILSPVLHYYGVSIRKNIIAKGAGSINLRSQGIHLYSRKLKRTLSRKRLLTEHRKKCKSKAESKYPIKCKEHTATRTTGLKIKFSVPGLHSKKKSPANKNETVSKQDLELNLSSNSNSTSPEQTHEQTSPKLTSNKLPIEESIPFKPFEKEVTSAKSAFISDALDKYLEDEKDHTPSSVNSYVHPLLQNKASSVTFKMPSKQSSSFKTLDMALHQRQMARIKSKVPTVAQTAEKLAKKLQHYSGVSKVTSEQAVSSGNEKGSTETLLTTVPDTETDSQHALQTEEGVETSFAPGDSAVTDVNPEEINPKEKVSIKERMESVKSNFKSALQKTKQIRMQQQLSRSDSNKKESALEEKLETVKSKLRKTPALQKKSPVKNKSQTNWVTKFKIVNSRLVQQLNTPGQSAHLINSDKGDQTPPEQLEELPQAQVGEVKIEEGSEPSADTTAAEGKKVKVKSRDKGKEKSNNEFLRLDHQITCAKEFCRLGCVCDSINLSLSVEQLTKHCRKPSCMFECVCQRVTENVRILRTRKRPNIFQESSMLFYDGLGMFSNNAYADPPLKNPGEKKTGIMQSMKPKTGGNTCARAIVYRRKPGAPNRTALCLPEQGKEPKVQVSSGSLKSQSQGLPKSDVDNMKSQTIFSIPTKTSENQNKQTVQTVLYTPIQLPVAGQAKPVVLYAPVNRLPGMTQAPKSAVILRQQSEKEADGKTVKSQTVPIESALPQIPVSSESRIVDSKVKPVASVSPSTARSSNQESSDGKLDASLSRDPSVQTLKTLDGTMLETQKCSTISAGTMCVSPETPDLSINLSHSTASVSNEGDLSASGSKDTATNLVIHTRNQVNGTLSPLSVNGIAKGAAHCSENVEVSPQPEPSKASSDVSMAVDTGEPGERSESIAAMQTPPMMSPKEATSDLLENASSNEGAGRISAIISRIESPQTTGLVDELSPTNDTEVQPSPEISSGQEKTASPKLSPTGTTEKTTSQTLTTSNTVLNLSKVLEAASNGPTLDSSFKTSEALASTMVLGTTQATTSQHKTSDPKGSIKVPAFSYVPKIEGSKKKSLTKTQVFLPGSSVSAIHNKSTVAATTRSPLLIEIQSECNWGNQRDDILSSIAKHTASKEGSSGVVRVGKFVVEILSKESQTHSIPSMITCHTVPKTKTVDSAKVQPLAAPKVQQSSQPTKSQPFVASVVPQTEVSTTVPEPQAINTKMKTRSQAKLPPYPELNTRPQVSLSMPRPPPYPGLNTRPQVPFSMPEPPPYPGLNTRPRVPFSMPRIPPYPELNTRPYVPFALPRLPPYPDLNTRLRLPFSIPKLPPYTDLNTVPHGPFSQPYVQVLPDLSVFPREKQPPPTVRQQLDNQKVVTLANAGTVTTATHNGTVPLLTSLPPGSFLLSDGNNAAGYLVPLSAIKEHIVSPAAESVPQEQPTNTASPSITSLSPPTALTASQKSSIPSYNLVPSILTSADPQLSSPANCLPRVSASTIDGSSMIASCPTSQVLGNHSHSPTYLGTGNHLSRSTGTPTENEKYVNGQNQLGDKEAFKADLPDLGEEGDLVINETSEKEVVQPNDDLAGDDEDRFVDVESLSDSEAGSSLLNPTLKCSFANPTPATNMVAAQTPPRSASLTLSSVSNLVKSRRKAPHVLRQPVPEIDEAGVSDVESFYKTQHMSLGIHLIGQQDRTGSPVGSWQPPSSSKGKRKRKSPVMQKQSVLALDEPEFTEKYFELTTDDEEEEDDQLKKHRRDKPNKVLHLIKERQRRQNQSDLFSELKILMLNDDDQRVAKVTILGMAFKEIKLLESKSFAIEVECAKLKQEHHLKRSKLASLLGHSVLDFPLPLLDQKEQDFAEYSKDLHSSDVNSEGFVSATASETASQDMDSEGADLSSLEDDDDDDGGAALGHSDDLMMEHEDRDTTADDEIDIVDVESDSIEDDYQTLIKPYPSSQYSLGDVVMSDGTNDTLPASIQDHGAGEMQPDLDGLSYKDSDLFSQDDPTLAFPMKLTAVSKSPAAINDDEEDTVACAADVESRLQDAVNEENEAEDSESPDCNIRNAERTVLKEHTMDVQSNNNPLQQLSTSHSDDVTESIEGDSEITSQTSSDSAPAANSEDGSPSPSVGSSDTNAEDAGLPGDLSELSPRDDESLESFTGSADLSEKYTELKDPPDQNVKDLEPQDPISIDVDEESEDDGVEMVDSIPATETSDVTDSDDVIMVNEDPFPGGNKPAKKATPTSPSKQNTPKLDSQGPSGPPVKLNVLAINIKAGIVRVTCDSGEVIPLAVVKASLDGTMQVAVEGDISSEKVEELLSKPEVMECLEKVADQACEKLSK